MSTMRTTGTKYVPPASSRESKVVVVLRTAMPFSLTLLTRSCNNISRAPSHTGEY